MIILKTTERTNLVIDEQNLNDRKIDRIIKVMFQNRFYNIDDWKCYSHEGQRPLYPNVRNEVENALPEAIKELKKYRELLNDKSQAPQPTQEPTPQTQSSAISSSFETMLAKLIAEQSVDNVIELAKPILKEHIINEFGALPQRHEIVTPQKTTKITGVTHEEFDKVLNLVSLDIPVFLSGQAGTGKNVICKQVAEALELDFYFTNAVTQEYQLKGFIDANGKYHETQFYKAFTQGGLFFLDEMDGSIPETLIILNSAIANRYFDFPTGKIEAHPDFRIISAGNTTGTGADIEYTGRFQLDASSLDRFALINIDYSPAIEKAITNNNDELIDFARAFRKVTNDSGIRCLCTYRSLERIAKLGDVFDLSETIKMSLTKGLGVDDLKIISKALADETGNGNKYTKAFKKLV